MDDTSLEPQPQLAEEPAIAALPAADVPLAADSAAGDQAAADPAAADPAAADLTAPPEERDSAVPFVVTMFVLLFLAMILIAATGEPFGGGCGGG